MRLVQISDTHFGTERAEVVEAVRAHVARLAPDVVILAGDITQRARTAQFDAAAEFLASLPARHRIAIPGNHDIPLFNLLARALKPYAAYRRAFGERESLWREGEVTILALDATAPWRHKDGRLHPAHLRARLAEARALAGDGALVVAAHQPLWTAWEEDRPQSQIGRHESAALIAEHRVDVVLSGHVHVPLIEPSSIGFPELAWTFVLSGSGTAVSLRVRALAPNSFNVLDLGGEALTVTRHDYLPPGFRPAAQKRFRRGPRGWVEVQASAPPASERKDEPAPVAAGEPVP